MSETGQQETGWGDHETEQRRAWLKLSYRARLLWLAQAKRFFQQAQKVHKQAIEGRAGGKI